MCTPLCKLCMACARCSSCPPATRLWHALAAVQAPQQICCCVWVTWSMPWASGDPGGCPSRQSAHTSRVSKQAKCHASRVPCHAGCARRPHAQPQPDADAVWHAVLVWGSRPGAQGRRRACGYAAPGSGTQQGVGWTCACMSTSIVFSAGVRASCLPWFLYAQHACPDFCVPNMPAIHTICVYLRALFTYRRSTCIFKDWQVQANFANIMHQMAMHWSSHPFAFKQPCCKQIYYSVPCTSWFCTQLASRGSLEHLPPAAWLNTSFTQALRLSVRGVGLPGADAMARALAAMLSAQPDLRRRAPEIVNLLSHLREFFLYSGP